MGSAAKATEEPTEEATEPATSAATTAGIKMARIIGASEQVISREIIWSSLLPFFFTGLKIAFPRAVSATIVGEFLVSTEGVGRYIEHARQVADTTGVFAGIVVAITLVLAINGLVNLIERWARRYEA